KGTDPTVNDTLPTAGSYQVEVAVTGTSGAQLAGTHSVHVVLDHGWPCFSALEPPRVWRSVRSAGLRSGVCNERCDLCTVAYTARVQPARTRSRSTTLGTPVLAGSRQWVRCAAAPLSCGSTRWISVPGAATSTRPAAGHTCRELPTTTGTSARATKAAASASSGTSSPNHTM